MSTSSSFFSKLSYDVVHLIELDMEGTIQPDEDPPQEMGDSTIEVTMSSLK